MITIMTKNYRPTVQI